MDNNANDSGSRVTRSLRKRLTSVDTDNSSRPGTPVPLKLTSISEICASPSRATRMTRRNSTTGASTPVKTPGKRGAATSAIIVENTENLTPARRSTRRRSVSVYENEETQSSLKIPEFSALDEETDAFNNQKSDRITRSQSKSPQQIKLMKSPPSPKDTNENKNKELELEVEVENGNSGTHQKRRKPGPKCKTKENNESQADSDVEISVLGNEIENIKNKSSNITTIVLTDEESNQTANMNLDEDENVESVLSGTKSMHPDAFNIADKEVLNKTELQIADTNTDLYETQKENVESIPEENNVVVVSDRTINEINVEKCNESSEQNIPSKNATINSVKNLEDDNEYKKCLQRMSQSKIENNEDSSKKTQNSIESPTETFNNAIAQKENHKDCTDENNGDDVLNVQVSTNANNEVENDVKTLLRNETKLSIIPPIEFEKDSLDRNATHVENSTKTKVKEKPSSEKIEIISVSTLTPYMEDSNVSDCKVPTKKVDFISSPSNDRTIKNVYPKTPASAKNSNSFIEINSSHENGSFQIERNSIPSNEFNKKIDDMQLGTLSQIKKMSPVTVQSSTPINTEVFKYKEMTPEIEKGILIAEEEKKQDVNKEEIKWINPSVKGTTVEGTKLDVVVTERNNTTSTSIFSDNNESLVQQVRIHKKKSIIFSSEDEEEEIESAERDKNDDEECELAPGEKPYNQKHDFHDDEAMEVNDYESGDSMDSEERREMEENDIPIDGESIGSHTTEDEHEEYDEEEDSENADSFIVSDNEEELEYVDSNNEEERIDEDVDQENNRKKKKTYKRLQRPAVSPSSSDEEVDIDKPREKLDHDCSNSDKAKQLEYEKESSMSQSDNEKLNNIKSNLELISKSSENMLDSSKLSDSALRLQCTAESESEEEETNGINEDTMNVSRKEILRKLNQSDRFNKSVRDLNPEVDTSPIENSEIQLNPKKTSYGNCESSTSISTDESANKTEFNTKHQCESHLGEVSVTSESDADKENTHKSKFQHQHKCESGLSVSLGNCKKPNNSSKRRQEWQQRSFTIDVTVKDGDLETISTDLKLKKNISSNSPSSSPDEQENHNTEEKIYSDNVRHMPLPLGNPLIRTRRQSLALPTNPDMEICSSHGINGASGKKLKRKSLGALSSCEFNPSQSFIDSIELHKAELMRQIGKRKRLSKSFCGASESHDNSIVDIDVRHLHKRSKLLEDNSIIDSHHDSIENINSSKIFNKDSSTPHQKKINKNDSNNNIQHILSRCDEILEAANRAKLEAKLNNKKSKSKLPKKFKKKYINNSSNDKNSDDVLRRPLEINRKDKTKTVLSKAIKAANVILGKNKHTTQINIIDEKVDLESKRLSPDVLKAIEESVSTKKKIKKEFCNDQKNIANAYTASTSAGKFVELPQTPEKKKKKMFIQLPTGKVSVEPVTPQKRSVLALNGAQFRESPITPYAVGFKVRPISILETKNMSSLAVKNVKRKRYHNETLKERGSPKSQWTQSGLFKEEEIPTNRRVCIVSKKIKNQQLMEREGNINSNFKENAIMRSNIKRGSKREIMLLKERRQVHDHY